MRENKFSSIEKQEGNKELVDSFFEEFGKMSPEEQDRVLGILKEKKEKVVSMGKNYKPEIEELE